MRARYTLVICALCTIWTCEAKSDYRPRREVSNNFPGPPAEVKPYQHPIPLGSHLVPVASAATLQNSYQPPISLLRSNEHHSAVSSPQNSYSSNVPRNYQSPPLIGTQSYVLQNQPHHQSHSVQYIPPANPQQSFSVFQQQPKSSHEPATSFSVHQQGAPQGQQTSYAVLSNNSGLPQGSSERTYSTHSKVVSSSHVPQQAIHKAPASEIQPDKGSSAKEKDAAKDEYVVYYYYYYDNDTTPNNQSLNFDDIPSLESYDNDKLAKEPEKSASARNLAANVNSIAPATKEEKDGSRLFDNSASQPRSVGETYARPDRPHTKPLEETLIQPLKPVSNVFRYGSNEVPRFPVLPNFIVTEVPTTLKPEIITPDSLTSESPTTHSLHINAQPDLKDEDDDDLNNVLDSKSDIKINEEKSSEEPTTTTTTTTTEPPTTTEEPTTTTEKTRRRPSFGGGRRRFNPSPPSSFSSNRNRQPSSRQSSTSSTTSTTSTTTTRPATRRSFQANRVRPRPPVGSNRPKPGSRITEVNEDKTENRTPEVTTASTSPPRSRYTSSSPRRFQSSRSRSQTTSSTTTTTRAPSGSTISSRSRPISRPRPNPITRNRPLRPGFPRPRPGSEVEETETTTVPLPTEETSPEAIKEDLATNDESNETEDEEETSEEETEEPTTTERSRFSALFRPRNRNALGNRPRPVIGNRPSRS